MFDDKNSQSNPGAGENQPTPPPVVPSQPSTPPSNLPLDIPAAPESAVPPPPPPASPSVEPKESSSEPEDILASIEKEEQAMRGPDTAGQFGPLPTARSADAGEALPPELSKSASSGGKKSRKLIVLGIIALVAVAVLGAAGWYAYSLYTSTTFDVPEQAQQQVNQPTNTNTNPLPSAQQPTVTNTNTAPAQPQQPAQPVRPVDSDQDGLSDEEEALYGSDPELVDTDSDGLTDRDEAVVFKTDPTNPDTDGDTYLDGDEVRNGYDPKGPGRILELP